MVREHSRRKEVWTPEEVGLLLDMYLSGRGLHAMAEKLQRPLSTLRNKVWKIATGYRKEGTYDFSQIPRQLPARQHETPLSKREKEVLEMGLYGDGQKAGKDREQAMTKERMASILGRPVSVVEQYVVQKRPVTEGFL